jgi:hypothetical protein
MPVLAAVTITLGLGACGGKSDEDVRTERATFVRKADAICDKAIDALARGQQPRTYETLNTRLQRDQKTLRSAVSDLHGLRSELGDSASAQIKAFDHRADAVVDTAQPLAEQAELADSSAARRGAERLRRAYAGLYDAAGKARLRRCGRGGNRAADTILFTVYRSEYITVNSDINLRLGFQRSEPKTFDAYRRYLRATVKVIVNYRRRIGRLAPPKALRRSHRLLLSRTTRALGGLRRLMAITNGGQAAIVTAGAQALALRVVHQGELVSSAERVIHRILRAPGSPRRPPSSGRTDST